jgi:hypothetical protein
MVPSPLLQLRIEGDETIYNFEASLKQLLAGCSKKTFLF